MQYNSQDPWYVSYIADTTTANGTHATAETLGTARTLAIVGTPATKMINQYGEGTQKHSQCNSVHCTVQVDGYREIPELLVYGFACVSAEETGKMGR
jgi:hypothetical protein